MTQSKPVQESRSFRQFIGGQWVAPESGKTFEHKSPATGEVVETIAWGGVDDATTAIAAAREAFDRSPWPHQPALVRAGILQRTAAAMRSALPALSALITREMGKPITTSQLEVSLSADIFDHHAALALDMRGDSFSHCVPTALGMTVSEPVGVVGVITPWNFPLLLTSWKLAPAIAAGCTIVAKPSEYAAGCIFELARLLAEAGLPAGVLNVITGPGETVGAELARSHEVDKISFTGSTAVGKIVMQAASGNLKKVSLELGGKCPNIVFPDADFGEAIGGAIGGCYLNSGQVCMAGSRLLVHEAIKGPFLEALAGAVRGLKVGDPNQPDTIMGPIVNEAQLEKVLRYIEIGKQEGARLVCGGERLTGPGYDGGHYVQPTIFDNVTPSMRIAQEEIFGPVLSVLTFKDAREALAIANGTCYGLAGAVWTKSLDTALQMAKGIKAGTVWINGYHSVGMGTYLPFGGYKQSGIGREVGRKGLDEYMETKSIHIKLGAI